MSSDSESLGNVSQSTPPRFSATPAQPVRVLHNPRGLGVTSWLACHNRFLLSRQFHCSHQFLCCCFTICHRHRPLQTPRLQALDDHLDGGFRGSVLCDRSCLYRSRLFFSDREYHQHVFSKSEKCVVQTRGVMIYLCSRFVCIS